MHRPACLPAACLPALTPGAIPSADPQWHLGAYSKEFLPENRGFTSYFGYLSE